MTDELSKDFHGVGIGPLLKILAVFTLYIVQNFGRDKSRFKKYLNLQGKSFLKLIVFRKTRFVKSSFVCSHFGTFHLNNSVSIIGMYKSKCSWEKSFF